MVVSNLSIANMSRKVQFGASLLSLGSTGLWLAGCWTFARSHPGATSHELVTAECVWYLAAIASIVVLSLPLTTLNRVFGRYDRDVQAPAIFIALGLPTLLLLFDHSAIAVGSASLSLSIPLLLVSAIGVWLCWPGHAAR